MSNELTTLNLRVDKDTKNKFKSCTSLNGESMTDTLRKLMLQYIEETEKKTE